MEIRSARRSDLESISPWTQDTFSWGDYIDDVYERWLLDPMGELAVVVDAEDIPVAMCNAAMLSPTEAWLQGIRVHPDHRRKGLGQTLSNHLVGWAQSWGAQVIRLMVEEENAPAHAHVQDMGFRPVAGFTIARRQVGEASVMPAGNGGRPIKRADRLIAASSAEAEPAFVAWSSDDLGRTARGLFPRKWMFRRLLVGDLQKAAQKGRLWVAPGGWVVAQPVGNALVVTWVHTDAAHAYDLARSLNLLAEDMGLERIEAFFPSLGWLNQGFRRAGCDIREDVVYARSV